MQLFCTNCGSYFPAGAECPDCHQARTAAETPTEPGQPMWRAQVEGGVAAQMAVARIRSAAGSEPALVVPWGHVPRRGDGRPADGGITVFRLSDGRQVWSRSLGMPVEGGVAVSHDVAVTGMGMRSIGAGEGWLAALSTQNGDELWPRRRMSGAVRCAPVIDDVRIYLAVNGGDACCLDVRNGDAVWRTLAFDQATAMAASPVVVKERNVVQCVLVATYGSAFDRAEGRVMACDERGRKLWLQNAGGNVRGTPLVERGRVFVTAFQSSPSTGILSAFDVRSGQPLWPPFVVQGKVGEQVQHNFSASPLVVKDTVYVGSLDHTLYAVDAATGKLKQEYHVGGGIATAPVSVKNLVVFGANDNKLYALDPDSGQVVWTYDVGEHVLTNPLVDQDDTILAAAGDAVVALPWHLGCYEWAAAWLEKSGRLSEAGDCYALAAHFSQDRTFRNPIYQRAADAWCAAGEPDKAAQMWRKFNQDGLVAQSFARAGEYAQMHDPQRACRFFEEAARLYALLRLAAPLNECTRALSGCAGLPFVDIRPVVAGTVVQWQAGKITIRLQNLGNADLPAPVRLWFGGHIQQNVEAEIPAALESGGMWNIPIIVVATRAENQVDIEVAYGSGKEGFKAMHGLYSFSLAAVPPPPEVKIGNVGLLRLEVSSTTAEGVKIVTHDIGNVRSEAGIGSIESQGNIGNIAGQDIGQVEANGSIGVVRRG